MHRRWRYLVLRKDAQDSWACAAVPPVDIDIGENDPLYVVLGALGEEGWELVSGDDASGYIFVRSASWSAEGATSSEIDRRATSNGGAEVGGTAEVQGVPRSVVTKLDPELIWKASNLVGES